MKRKPSSELRSKYRKVKLPDGSTRDEHRLLMERKLRRRLGPNEVVHHKNGDTLDNRLENLEVKPRWQHSLHHRTGPANAPKGSASPLAVLNEDVVREAILHVRDGGNVRPFAIARGLNVETLRKAVLGRRWKHVHEAMRGGSA